MKITNFVILFALSTALTLLHISTTGCSKDDGPCPGKTVGNCGLEGSCVRCIGDNDCYWERIQRFYSLRTSVCDNDLDCNEGLACLVDYGVCVELQHCTVNGECMSYCPPLGFSDCSPDRVCVDSRCLLACQDDNDCLEGVGTCQAEEYCVFERCSLGGSCPAGFERVPGSLACDVL